MAISFACPRCGRSSSSLDDIREGYCGNCRGWTGPPRVPGGPVSQEQVLTPRVVLSSPAWEYQGTQQDGRVTVWRFDVLRGPWVGSWRPDDALGAFEFEWADSELTLRVSAEVMARAVMDMIPLPGSPARAWSWEELRQLYQAQAAQFGPLTWDRPDSDPLADMQQARRLLERYAQAHPDPDRTAGDIVGALSGAAAGFSGELTEEQYAVVQGAMQQWGRARQVAAARRPPRPSRVRRLRTRQALDEAEALIARLDGEGYGVAEKARRIEAAGCATPPDYLDRNHAMSWHPGDPAL